MESCSNFLLPAEVTYVQGKQHSWTGREKNQGENIGDYMCHFLNYYIFLECALLVLWQLASLERCFFFFSALIVN